MSILDDILNMSISNDHFLPNLTPHIPTKLDPTAAKPLTNNDSEAPG